MKINQLYIAIIFITLFGVYSCSKDSTSSTTSNNSVIKENLEVSWQLIKKSLNGVIVTPTPILDVDFYKTGNYYMNKDSTTVSGTWSLSDDGIYINLIASDSTKQSWQIVDITTKLLKVRYNNYEFTFNPY